MQPSYFAGLDLGPVQEPTALAVLERTRVADAPGRTVAHYAVRHLQRFTPGTPYPALAAELARLFLDPPLRDTLLAVDQTGVGRPVVELLRQAKVRARLRPITITSGHRATYAGDELLLPKKDLISALQLLLQSRRLRVSPALPEAQTLVQELETFRMKVTVADEESLAWREGRNDDLVLAVAVAAWEAERDVPWKAYLI